MNVYLDFSQFRAFGLLHPCGNEIWPVYVTYYKRKIFIKTFYEKFDLENSSKLFLIFKESS